MKPYLSKLKSLINSSGVGTILTFENLSSEIIMNKSYRNTHKYNHEDYNKIPKDYLEFLNQFNGGILFKIEDISGFKLFNLDEIYKECYFQKENFGNDWDDDIYLFGMCIGDNEYLGFKVKNNSYKIIHCIMEDIPSEWEIIGNSFEEFINILIKEKGKKYWLDD